MKKLVFTTALLTLTASTAFAVDGTINITGKVTDKTCTITGNNGKNYDLVLPTVSTQTLATAGNVAGRTPFTLKLSDCSEGKVATYFEPGPTVDAETGRLKNQKADGADNVQVQLLGSNFGFIPVLAIDKDKAQPNSQWIDVTQDGGANLNYYAEYYATAQSKAGDVATSVQYTIIYQ